MAHTGDRLVESDLAMAGVDGDLFDNVSVACQCHCVDVAHTGARQVEVSVREHVYVTGHRSFGSPCC